MIFCDSLALAGRRKMYAMLDQPIDRLSPGSRLALWAMRAWVTAVEANDCAPGVLAPVFLRSGVIEVLPHFHRIMVALNANALEDVKIAPLAHPRIAESEALILKLWIDARAEPLNARKTLALLLEQDAVELTIEALICVATSLAKAALPAEGLTSPAGASS